MLDFLMLSTRRVKKNGQDIVEIYPRFRLYPKSSDLMVRGGDFYAIWLEDRGLWSTNEYEALMLIDRYLDEYQNTYQEKHPDSEIRVLHMWDSESGMIDAWHKYCQKQLRDSYEMLDEKLIFSNTESNKKDYASKRLPYPLEPCDTPGYNTLMNTLYSEEERHKIEWAIGSIVSGESKNIQKFQVFYGSAGTGKSTVLNIIQQLFEGYYTVFDAKALGSSNSSFALEPFKTNPLVAIQHDGDLSRIEDNTRLNSLVSHELMTVNEKFKSTYTNRFKCFLFMGTNKPVKITDGKSGLLRRLIDVSPTGEKLTTREYKSAVKKIKFELGGIACHCLEVYESDPGAYDDYVPKSMLGASNDFYNFVIESFAAFKKEDGTTLKAAWEMYKNYCDDAKIQYPYSLRNFKEELKNYFKEFSERFVTEDGTRLRSYYNKFRVEKFFEDEPEKNPGGKKEQNKVNSIEFAKQPSVFDKVCSNETAQYANENGTPIKKWENVKTTLKSIDTSKLHYVKVPENHIVIDFDIKGADGKKSFEKNLEEASKWPPTYAELSKSGAGIHLHYIYTGDAKMLSRVYDDNIEIKVFTGNGSLRRQLTLCNALDIATISSGLPLKGDDKVINFDGLKNEKAIRTAIKRNLNKEIHPGTKPSVDFIHKILEDAYKSGMSYNVSDMKNAIIAFAASSTNHSEYCLKLVGTMHFESENHSVPVEDDDDEFIFYDVEVFPNLFLINWKVAGEGKPVVRMINPGSSEVEELIRHKLIGFNCRRYDNHILYARLLGYTNEQLFELSGKIVSGSRNAFFGEAYNISYTDVYDFAAKKQSLKKWEIELGIHHQELGLPWDKPVAEELWPKVAEYCDNDVIATEATFDHLKGDFTARKILAELAGMSVNDTTNSLTTRIVFGREKKPKLTYTNLATGEQEGEYLSPPWVNNAFPGYEYVIGDDNKPHNMYRGTDIGFGGYIKSWPGIYVDVALLDVKSLHPNSTRAMNCFGEYTKNYTDIIDARVAIKEKRFDDAKGMLDGKLTKYLDDESQAKSLAQALKIAINSVYGLTSASFSNPFRDDRNKNNIVALRGALFMRTLEDEVTSRGFDIVAIKTDSIKIANATPEIIEFCMEFAKKYGYEFDHEATYSKICQINDADYVAMYKDGPHVGEWTVTGKQFAIPYVFKTLFSREEIVFKDLCETFAVSKGDLYLDMNENLPDVSMLEKELAVITKGDREHERQEELKTLIEDGHDLHFIGRVGQFTPIRPGHNGGVLYRVNEGKNYAAAGSTGYRWLESEMVRDMDPNIIDHGFYRNLVDNAAEAISKYGDLEWFISDMDGVAPWTADSNPDDCPFNVR